MPLSLSSFGLDSEQTPGFVVFDEVHVTKKRDLRRLSRILRTSPSSRVVVTNRSARGWRKT